MPGHDVVVIGFSAGGVEALARLVAELPNDFPAAIFVVHHFPAESVSALPNILRRAGPLDAAHPTNGQKIEPGRIYVGRPDQHLLIRGDRILLTRGPRENGHRPGIDPLFRTAAKSYGSRAIGVVLSGTLDDGTLGLMMIKQHGGVTVVQDPEEALYQGMPLSAIQKVAVDYVLPIAEIATLLVRLAHERSESLMEQPFETSPEEEAVPDPAEGVTLALEEDTLSGPPSALTCPDCGGALWQRQNGDLIRYRCHVGHAFTAEGLLVSQDGAVEQALWSALRALQEKAELGHRMAERSRDRGLHKSAFQFESVAKEAEHGSHVLRQLLLDGTGEPPFEAEQTLDPVVAAGRDENQPAVGRG